MSDTQKNEIIELITTDKNREDFIKIKQALDSFLDDVSGKLRYLNRNLNLRNFQRGETKI